jgi:hypothetical protein
MPELNMTTASEALKRWYLPGLQYQLNNANPVLSVMERDSESVAGEKAYFALRYGRQGGIGARADNGTLPTPNSRKTKQAATDTKNIFARIQITDKTMKASRSNQGAFVNLLEADLDDALTDARDSLSRMVYGDGTGKLATCTAQTTVTTLVVSSVQYLTEGMLIDILDNTNTVKAGMVAREVTAVDDVANSITISGAAVTTLTTDYIVVNGSYNLELTGFGAVFTPDNTLYGVNRATNKWFNPQVMAAVGSISETKLQQATDDAERKAGGNLNFYATTYGVRRSYQNILIQYKRMVDPMKLVGGWEALSYNNKPLVADKYCPTGTLFGLDLTTWKMLQLGDWDWISEDGAVLSRVADKPIWEATLVKYAEMICNKPRGNVKLTGITEN